jgi:hypothetical protein
LEIEADPVTGRGNDVDGGRERMWKRLVDGWDAGLCDVKLYSVDGEMMCGNVEVWE